MYMKLSSVQTSNLTSKNMQFSTNETTSLEKIITTDTKQPFTNPKDLDDYYEISRCVGWIKTNNLKKVILT